MKKILTLLALLLACVGIHAQSWIGDLPQPGAYSDQTVIFAQLKALNFANTDNLIIGAFIDGKCRAQAESEKNMTGGPKLSASGNPVYILTVPGDKTTDINDLGKTITFKVYDPMTGFEYPLTNVATFDGETQGYPPSEPTLVFNLEAATSFILSLTEVEVGKTYNLYDYLSSSSATETFPDNLNWTITSSDPTSADFSNYVSLTGSTLKGLSPIKGLWLNIQGNMSDPIASCSFNVVRHATSITLLKQSITVNKDDQEAMKAFMKIGNSYTVGPDGATDEVQWEKIDENNILALQSELTDTFYLPTKAGTAKIRPYIIKTDNTILYPADDAYITVTVIVPVQNMDVSYSLYQEDPTHFVEILKANVGDNHLYERIQRMISFTPSEATDKTFTLTIPDASEVLSLEGTTLTANKVGSEIVTVKANGTNPNMPILKTINVEVVKPVTATVNSSTIHATFTDGNPQNITADIQANVTFGGNATDWGKACSIGLTGSAVTGIGIGVDDSGIIGNYTTSGEGTTTVTIDVRWPNYDAWGITSDELTFQESQTTFDVIVQQFITLSRFNVAITNAVAGKSGTITLTPDPVNASFDPNKIGVTITNGYEVAAWSSLLNVTKGSQTNEALVFNFTSAIPGYVYVRADMIEATSSTQIPLNDPTVPAEPDQFSRFEIGYPLDLNAGWQWRSIPYGAVVPDSMESTFSTANLIEIRTSDKLLYNDPSCGFYGTLMSGDGIKQGQLFKVNMKNSNSSVLYDTTSEHIFGTLNGDGTITITLKPGWTWIGSPYFYDHQFDDVFDGGTASTLGDGAIIIGKTGFSTLTSGVWVGNETIMKAGEGYVIKNPSAETKTITFKSEYNDLQPSNDTPNAGVKAFAPQRRIWEYDHTRFMNNMNIVAELEGVAHPEQYSIGAFVGDECRGEGVIMDGKAFITVHCDNGEPVSFKLYSPYTNDFYTVDEGVKAVSFLGSMQAPFKLHATGVVDGINTVASPAGEANTETYDLIGRRVNKQLQGVGIRRTADGKVRKVIVK